MTLTNILAIAAIVAAVGGALAYILYARRHGKKCIGCPDSDSCHRGAASSGGCSGGCGSCGHCHGGRTGGQGE